MMICVQIRAIHPTTLSLPRQNLSDVSRFYVTPERELLKKRLDNSISLIFCPAKCVCIYVEGGTYIKVITPNDGSFFTTH